MTEHTFTLVLASDPRLESGEAIEALGDAGCLDATISRLEPAVWIAEFTRAADTFRAALTSAIRDVRRVRLSVRRVEPDEYISLSEVAAYLGRSLESVRLLAHGQRGQNGEPFPPPALRVTDRGHLGDARSSPAGTAGPSRKSSASNASPEPTPSSSHGCSTAPATGRCPTTSRKPWMQEWLTEPWPAEFGDMHEGIDLASRVMEAGYPMDCSAELVWLARRNLPAALAVAYPATWLVLDSLRLRSRAGAVEQLRGYADGLRAPCGRRAPISWRTVWRMTLLGRPPVV